MEDTTQMLNDIEKIRAVDPGNMYNRIFDFPEQVAEALKLASGWNVSAADFPDVKNIVVIGMGGSAIGGDLCRSLLSGQLMIPFHVCRHYQLPEFVDDESLVIASSYSGNTEETLSALDDALARKAMICALSTGGMLEDVAGLNEIPLLHLPTGLQPRAALGYSFVPIAALMEKLGLVKGITEQLSNAVTQLRDWRENYIEDTPVAQNLAKQLAQKMHGKLPIIYGGPTLTDVIAVRWKGQVCENAKNLAFANTYAEFNHNELVGWCEIVKPHTDHLMVVQLRDKGDHPQIARRMDIVKGIIEKTGVEVIDVTSRGVTEIDRMMSLIQLGDFTSYYLAVLNEVDPTPVEAIETLKKALAAQA
ncbi:MAG: bifunctional phosphoglucose/phosphomannose isomerase [Candidatus Zixiibacteriota bacterium]|nr:MAG: bifunctional phosphoglucose/phosphomannose isomerase [candidate division Zixibacteria bacterium]